jgi:hypothetical protein
LIGEALGVGSVGGTYGAIFIVGGGLRLGVTGRAAGKGVCSTKYKFRDMTIFLH